MGDHLPRPGQKRTLDQETENLRKELAKWVGENEKSFKTKPGKSLLELEHPEKNKNAEALLKRVGLLIPVRDYSSLLTREIF